MKAIVVRSHGGPEKLEIEDWPMPSAQAGSAVVRVHAVALNHLDVWLRKGVPGHKFPLPMIPGSEVAGTIDQIEKNDEGWSAGDAVVVAPGVSCGSCPVCLSGNDPLCDFYGILGEGRHGGCAEFIEVPIRNLLPKPERLSMTDAAAALLDFLTAWHMLVARVQLKSNEVVLIHAAGSGVGSAAIQIAKLWKCRVIVTAGSERKLARAREVGADEAINYTTGDFVQEVRSMTQKRGVDVIFEHVGGDTFERSLRCLGRGGRLVTCGATTGAEVRINLRPLFFKLQSILGSTMGSLAELKQVLKLLDEGLLEPVVDRVLPFEQVREAHALLESRAVFGKLVLTLV